MPAISGADPCTASARAMPPSPMLQLKDEVYEWDAIYLSNARLRNKVVYLGVRPKPPIKPAQRSLIMSP